MSLEKLWGAGGVQMIEIFMQGKLTKDNEGNVNKKQLENFPPSHNFSNGPPLVDTRPMP